MITLKKQALLTTCIAVAGALGFMLVTASNGYASDLKTANDVSGQAVVNGANPRNPNPRPRPGTPANPATPAVPAPGTEACTVECKKSTPPTQAEITACATKKAAKCSETINIPGTTPPKKKFVCRTVRETAPAAPVSPAPHASLLVAGDEPATPAKPTSPAAEDCATHNPDNKKPGGGRGATVGSAFDFGLNSNQDVIDLLDF